MAHLSKSFVEKPVLFLLRNFFRRISKNISNIWPIAGFQPGIWGLAKRICITQASNDSGHDSARHGQNQEKEKISLLNLKYAFRKSVSVGKS